MLSPYLKISSGVVKMREEPGFSLARYKDDRVADLAGKTDKRTLAVWAVDCAGRVMPYFEREHPADPRPGRH